MRDREQGLSKINRLKDMRRDIAERAYRTAMLEVSVARKTRDNAAGHLQDRRDNGARERKDNIARIFEGDHADAPVNAHIAVAAWLRTGHEIRMAKAAVDHAEVALSATREVASARRATYAAAEKDARKIAIMRERLLKDKLRRK